MYLQHNQYPRCVPARCGIANTTSLSPGMTEMLMDVSLYNSVVFTRIHVNQVTVRETVTYVNPTSVAGIHGVDVAVSRDRHQLGDCTQ
jgi:hypothetical protein